MNTIIFGSGIAGLSTAHFLMERGYKVTVIESLSIPGGLARSGRIDGHKKMPSEYSWRGFGPWYHNTFDIMKKIPISQNKTVYDVELSHPMEFILFEDCKENHNEALSDKLSLLSRILFFLLICRIISASSQRKNNIYANINASKYLYKNLSRKTAYILSQTFGPWVGSDSSRASSNHISEFYMRNLNPGPNGKYDHDMAKPPFTHKGGDGWLTHLQPINESWFNPWVKFLKSKGVKFEFNTSLTELHFNTHKNVIDYTIVKSQGVFKKRIADTYVLAINPYITYDILQKSPKLLVADKQLQLFKSLVADDPHIQISFRIAFSDKINFKHNNSAIKVAIILLDSEFNITILPQDELWNKEVYLGENIRSLWSGTAARDNTPGKLYGLPMKNLTKDQFINEIKYQLYRCKGLNEFIKKRNNGRNLQSFPIVRIEVWHTWEFPEISGKCILDPKQPKWVNNTRNHKYLPTTKTSILNLYLAGAHTKTNVNLYSMEAAVESGRRVADIMTGINTIIPQHIPYILRPLQSIDSILYQLGLPNIIDILVLSIHIALLLGIYYMYIIYYGS